MNGSQTVRVLLLEDDDEYQRLLQRYLQKAENDYAIECVPTVAEAVGRLRAARFDVVLSDLDVPDSKGLSTIARLREHSGPTPIIALTGLDDDQTEKAILETGVQDYLLKGEANGAAIDRAVQHAIQRQYTVNEHNTLLAEVERNRAQLEEQAAQLKRKNRRLRRMHRLAHEFVDNVSHDFRTPLAVINDYVALIREGLVGDISDAQRELLDKVAIRTDDLNNMVDDLLDVSKIDAGLLGCWRRQTRAADIVQRCEGMLRQRAKVKGVQLTFRVPDALPDCYCDCEKAIRVLTNLAVNAIKFTPAEKTVVVWAEADHVNQQVVFGVTDEGPGIESGSLKAMFERFKQNAPASQAAQAGFGLGLNIAQNLCRVNLGELNASSVVGEGSTFSFTAPYASPVEVFRRWSKTRRPSATKLRLIELTVDTLDGATDLDHFLNTLLRRDDLLLWVDDNRWLLVHTASKEEASVWRKRLRKEIEKANRNRPHGPLPSCRVKTRAAWGPAVPAHTRLKDFERAAASALDVPTASAERGAPC